METSNSCGNKLFPWKQVIPMETSNSCGNSVTPMETSYSQDMVVVYFQINNDKLKFVKEIV